MAMSPDERRARKAEWNRKYRASAKGKAVCDAYEAERLGSQRRTEQSAASKAKRREDPEYLSVDKERRRVWRAHNQEALRERHRRYNTEHPEVARAWHEANPDYNRQWIAANPGKVAGYRHARRARVRDASADLFDAVEVFEADRYVCYLCGRLTDPTAPMHAPNKTVLEHKTPLSCGGTHTRDNVATACWDCNARKGSRTVAEFWEAFSVRTN